MLKNRYIILIIFLFSIAIMQSHDKIKLVNISIEGNIRINNEEILSRSKLWIGRQIDAEDIQNGINNLWKLGRFEDIQIFIIEETVDGIKLTIKVKELPILEKIKFEGNKKVSNNSLKEELGLKEGQLFSDNDIFIAIKSIKEKYFEKNFHNIIVDVSYSAGKNDYSKNILFSINEGKKIKIKNIEFIGNKEFSNRKLLKQFKETKMYRWYSPWRGSLNRDNFKEDIKLLKSFYKKNGFYDFYIINAEEQITDNKKGIKLLITVYEGPKYYIRKINWNGNYVQNDEDLNNTLNMYKGEVFNKEKFDLSVNNNVGALYRDKGYFYSQIDQEIIPIDQDSLDINFNIIENQIVNIRKILITGNSKTQENVIRRRLYFYPGDIFNQNKLIDGLRDIMMLNYFQNVFPNVSPVDEKNIDIIIDLEEKQTGQAQFSMGYNGALGLTGGGAFEFPNFLGKGQNFSISYQRGVNSNSTIGQSNFPISSQNSSVSYQSMSISFMDPRVLDTRNLIGVSINYSERGRGQGTGLPFDIYKLSGSARWGKQFKWPDRFFHGTWVASTSNSRYLSSTISDLTNYFSYSIENSIQYSGDNSPYFITSGQSITQIISRDSRNHPEYPSIGSKFIWKSTLSGSFLGGDEDYHKHEFDFNWFNPIIGNLVFKHNIKFGVIKSIPVDNNERSIIPPNAKFFMGGSGIPYGEMLRGYQDNTIGPFGLTRPIGGNVIIKYGLELRYKFSDAPTVYALAFTDIGNLWFNFEEVDPFNLKRSLGIGIRTFMPMIGMLGFDMGYGFDDTIYDSDSKPQGWNYHILFGMPFN